MDFVIQLEPSPLPTPPNGPRPNVDPTQERREPPTEQPCRYDHPKSGLLTQTIIPSPIVQWVFPARVRSWRRNDVVFVGERCLQIKEAVSGIHLEDAVTKSDFDANIIAAKVLNVGAELPWESQMRLGTGIDSDDLPSQILVLSLDSRELAFLHYSELDGGQFIHYHRPLPSDVSSFERFGRNIAVDPRYVPH